MITAVKTNAVITASYPCILAYSGKALDRLSLPSLYQLNEATCLQTKLNMSDFLRACSSYLSGTSKDFIFQ